MLEEVNAFQQLKTFKKCIKMRSLLVIQMLREMGMSFQMDVVGLSHHSLKKLRINSNTYKSVPFK